MGKCTDCGAQGQPLQTCTRCQAEYCDDCVKDGLCYECYSIELVVNKQIRREDDADFVRKQQIEDAMTGDA